MRYNHDEDNLMCNYVYVLVYIDCFFLSLHNLDKWSSFFYISLEIAPLSNPIYFFFRNTLRSASETFNNSV